MKHILNPNIDMKFFILSLICLIGGPNLFSKETDGYVCEIRAVSKNGLYVGSGLLYFEEKSMLRENFENLLSVIDTSNNDPMVSYACCVIGDMEEGHKKHLIINTNAKTHQINYSFLKSQSDYQLEIKRKSIFYTIRFWHVTSDNCKCKSEFSNFSELGFNLDNSSSSKYKVIFFKELRRKEHSISNNEFLCKTFKRIIRKGIVE